MYGGNKMSLLRDSNNSVALIYPALVIFLSVGIWIGNIDAAEKLDLKLQLKPKQKHNMRIIEDNNISQKAMGQSLDIHQTKTTELEFEVETVDANSIASIKVTYLKLKEKEEYFIKSWHSKPVRKHLEEAIKKF